MDLSVKEWLSVLKLGTSCGVSYDGEEPTKGAPFTVIQVPLTHAHVIDVDDEAQAMTDDHARHRGQVLCGQILDWADALIWTDRGLQFVQLGPPPASMEVVGEYPDQEVLFDNEDSDIDEEGQEVIMTMQDPNFVKFSLKRGFWAMRTHGKTTNEPRTACALTQRGKAFAAAWSQLAKSAQGNDLDSKIDP